MQTQAGRGCNVVQTREEMIQRAAGLHTSSANQGGTYKHPSTQLRVMSKQESDQLQHVRLAYTCIDQLRDIPNAACFECTAACCNTSMLQQEKTAAKGSCSKSMLQQQHAAETCCNSIQNAGPWPLQWWNGHQKSGELYGGILK